MWDWNIGSSVLLKTIWPPLTALRWSVSRSWGWPGPRPAARPGRGQTRRGKSSHYWGANIFFYRYFIFYHWAGLWVAVALEWDCWQFYTLMTWWGSELPHHSQVTPQSLHVPTPQPEHWRLSEPWCPAAFVITRFHEDVIIFASLRLILQCSIQFQVQEWALLSSYA